MKTKNTSLIMITFILGLVGSYLFLNQSNTQLNAGISDDNPYERIPVIDAYYEGEKIWFIHTDASDKKMAKGLSAMVSYNTVYAPALGDFLDENVGTFYVFTNGISQSDVAPWGGGPFGYQIDVFDSIPGMPGYTSVRSPRLVTWAENVTPRILDTAADILEAEVKGEVTIKKASFNVNVPIVKWTGEYLGGQGNIN